MTRLDPPKHRGRVTAVPARSMSGICILARLLEPHPWTRSSDALSPPLCSVATVHELPDRTPRRRSDRSIGGPRRPRTCSDYPELDYRNVMMLRYQFICFRVGGIP